MNPKLDNITIDLSNDKFKEECGVFGIYSNKSLDLAYKITIKYTPHSIFVSTPGQDVKTTTYLLDTDGPITISDTKSPSVTAVPSSLKFIAKLPSPVKSTVFLPVPMQAPFAAPIPKPIVPSPPDVIS